uniref:SSD domain-containing protein n=1 Tax=Setaria digitata TaxID=48799 RepID=A0A915Q2L6_9BILA
MSLESPEQTVNGALLVTDDDEVEVERNEISKNDSNITYMEHSDNLSRWSDHCVQTPFNSHHITNHGSTSDSRRSKLLFLWRYLTLRGLFRLLGENVGSYPIVYIFLSLLISTSSFGMFKIVLRDRIRDGYTPTNAPSRYEMNVLREFWNSTDDPMVTVVLLTAKDNGSMLRDDYLNEVEQLTNYLMNNHSVIYNNQPVTYENFCSPYCRMNIALKLFKQSVDVEKIHLQCGEPLSKDTSLNYPVAKIDGFNIHLERNFFGITLKEMPKKDAFIGQNITADKLLPNQSYAQLLSNLQFVKVVLALYRADRSSPDMERKLPLWELSVFEFARKHYKNDLIDMQVVIGTEILNQEMIKDGQKLAPFFAAGFGFMMFFVTVTVLTSAIFYNAMDWGKVLVAFGSILCPILSITSSYGIISLFGIRTNSLMLVMPFLIMGIGVDDAFLMIHPWQRLALHTSSVSVRLGLVFEEVGPSITITSLTNFISFGIGALTPTPEIRLFCVSTAIAMGLDYLYELILFGPVLALASHCEKRHKKYKISSSSQKALLHGWRLQVDTFMKWILRIYCRILEHRCFTIFLAIAVITYWYFAIIGALNIKTRLDTVKILPRDSPIQTPNRILNDIIWDEYHPVTVLVNNPLDIRKQQSMQRFWQLVNDFESLPLCRGNISTLLWLRDYEHYYKYGDPISSFWSFFGFDDHQSAKKISRTETGLDFDKLDNFLQSPFYSHWNTCIIVTDTNDGVRVNRFWFVVAYRNTSTWEVRIDLMQKWRKIAENYKTGTLTLICMAVVCALFIPNPCSIITASIAIASISLGVFGFLSWWHFDLDPVTTVAVLMSIGLSVDFTAHVSYHYQLTNRREIRNKKIIKIPIKGPHEKLEHTLRNVGWPMIQAGPHEKLEHTLRNVGWPMIQAGASTVMCVLPLVFLQSYSPMVFFKTIILVVSWSLLHGLIILPALLGALPDCLTNANCYRTFLSTSSQKSCRYVGPQEMDQIDGQEMESSD